MAGAPGSETEFRVHALITHNVTFYCSTFLTKVDQAVFK